MGSRLVVLYKQSCGARSETRQWTCQSEERRHGLPSGRAVQAELQRRRCRGPGLCGNLLS